VLYVDKFIPGCGGDVAGSVGEKVNARFPIVSVKNTKKRFEIFYLTFQGEKYLS
jgi:hypothetical protein